VYVRARMCVCMCVFNGNLWPLTNEKSTKNINIFDKYDSWDNQSQFLSFSVRLH